MGIKSSKCKGNEVPGCQLNLPRTSCILGVFVIYINFGEHKEVKIVCNKIFACSYLLTHVPVFQMALTKYNRTHLISLQSLKLLACTSF